MNEAGQGGSSSFTLFVMRLEVIWGLVCVFLVHWSEGKPFDADEIQENMQMAAMNAAGIAMDAAQNVKASAMFKGGIGIGGSGSPSSEEDRKRRRRALDDAELAALETRQKRSPCGRLRRMQTTQPPATTAAPAAAADETEPDLRRRRRRSVEENEVDESVEIIPVEKKFEDDVQEIREKIRRAIKTALDNMNAMLEAINRNIRRSFDKNEQEPEAM